MKKATAVFLFLLSIYSTNNAKFIKKEKPGRAQNARVVISNLAKMIGEIGSIIENPHDLETIGEAVSGIADNIIKITVNAVQQRKISLQEAGIIFDQLQLACNEIDLTMGEMVHQKRSLLL